MDKCSGVGYALLASAEIDCTDSCTDGLDELGAVTEGRGIEKFAHKALQRAHKGYV